MEIPQDQFGADKILALSRRQLCSAQREEVEICSATVVEAGGTACELRSELAESLARTAAAKKETDTEAMIEATEFVPAVRDTAVQPLAERAQEVFRHLRQ